MMIRLFLVLSSIFLVVNESQACQPPSRAEALAFFDNEAQWIEVQKNDHSKIEKNNTIELVLRFSNFSTSQAFKGGKLLGSLEQVCLTKNPKQLKVRAQNYNFLVTQKNYGLQVDVLFFSFHLRPLSLF